jgi:chitinase
VAQLRGASLQQAVEIVDTAATLSFDFIGSWDLSSTGFAASLFAPSGYSVDLVVGAWRDTGADVSKLQIGMPLYGWGWQGVSSIDDGLFQPPGGPADGGDVVAGRYAYDDLDPLPTGYTRFYDSERSAPWLYSPTDEVFITYEDRVSAAAKAQYVIDQGLAGVMGWEISYDRRGVLLGTVVRTFQLAAEGSGE